MIIKKRKKVRIFEVGKNLKIKIKDMGKIHLLKNEQLTFVTNNKNEYDFCKKDWGFYATPSVNSRLKQEGFKTAIVKNKWNQIYVMVVEKKKISSFNRYCKNENQKVLKWIDEIKVRKINK